MLNPFIGHKSYNRPCSITTSMSLSPISLLVFSLFVSSFRILAHGSNLNDDIEIQWGDGRGKISPDGKLLSLSLDKLSGSGFLSKNKYLFGRLDMEIKLIRGNSAGTVTTFYVSWQRKISMEARWIQLLMLLLLFFATCSCHLRGHPWSQTMMSLTLNSLET